MKKTDLSPTVIIGAGPAGLAVAARLRRAGGEFLILEKSDKVGFMWHQHYDRLCLHTVKELSHLPHMPFPDEYPLYVPRAKLVEYFDLYAKKFQINPTFNTTVTAVRKSEESNGWLVIAEDGQKWQTQDVVICVGTNRIPNVPTWEGEEKFGGTIIHSRNYRNPQPYLKQKVLVVGMGNTGAEIALDLALHEVDVCLSVRGAVNIVPRDIAGRPTQLTARKLAKLPFGLGDWIGTQIRKRVVGDLSKYGLKSRNISPMVQLKETGMTPVIDIGTVEQIKKGNIKVLPEIWAFEENEIVFEEGIRKPFDAVILATGYHAEIENLVVGVEPILDKYKLPKIPSGDGDHKGLHFVGFDNYKLGGILGTIYSDSETVTQNIMKLTNQVEV